MKNQRVDHTGMLEWLSLLRLDKIVYLYLLKINGHRINWIGTKQSNLWRNPCSSLPSLCIILQLNFAWPLFSFLLHQNSLSRNQVSVFSYIFIDSLTSRIWRYSLVISSCWTWMNINQADCMNSDRLYFYDTLLSWAILKNQITY